MPDESEVLERARRWSDAVGSWSSAIMLCRNQAELRHLSCRRSDLEERHIHPL